MSGDVDELEREAGALPDRWRSRELGDIITLEYGRSLPEKARQPGSVAVYGSNGVVGTHNEALVPNGGIIVGRKGTAGSVTVSPGPFWPIDTTYFVKARQTVDWDWLAATLHYVRLNELNEATGVPGLNRDKAYRQTILLPPLDEQRRIAEVLRSVDEAIAAAGAVLECAQAARSAVLNDLLRRADGNWQTVPFSEAAQINPKRVLPRVGAVPFLDMANLPLNGAVVNVTQLRPVSSGGSRFRAGDTLFARITPCAENGKLGYVEIVMGGDVAQGSTEFIVMAGREGVTTSQYVRCLAGWDELRQQAIGLMEGTSGRQRIPSWAFDMIDVPLPPLERQEQITTVMQAMDSVVLECQGALQQQQSFKTGLMSDLLSGRVRVPA